MKKQLIILIGFVCFVTGLLAFPASFGDILMKKGTYSYYLELMQIWKPVSPEMSRIIIFGDPNQEMKYDMRSRNYEKNQEFWKIKFDEQYQFSIAQGYFVYVDVTPGEHTIVCKKVKKNLEVEAGQTYYLEMLVHYKKDDILSFDTDATKAANTLSKQRHVFRDPQPFNEQPAKPKALLKGNKVITKK